jgi:hypothetical protein
LPRLSEPPTHGLRNFILTVVLIAILVLLAALARGGPPDISFASLPPAIGAHTGLSLTLRDGMGVRRVEAYYEQNGERLPVLDENTGIGRSWFVAPAGARILNLRLAAGRDSVAGLKDGAATLVVTATAGNLRGSTAVMRRGITVRSTPPSVAALSTQQYVNQGGAEMVVYQVSPGVTQSGVETEGKVFPGYQAPNAPANTMFCIFAYPYDAGPHPNFELFARDDAGNETRQSFPVRAFPRRFPTSRMQISDSFIQQVVLPIIAHTPSISQQSNLLDDFLLVNRDLRRTDARRLVDMSGQSVHEFLWHGAFIHPPSKVEANFADHRVYVYNGQIVDQEDHLGYDLAGTKHMNIPAANAGRVLFVGYFGIYGNTVVLDHGFGLLSLYAHMNDFSVKPGETVQQGQLLGHSDSTGMATGDHLHFSMLLNGDQVDPKEWWDPHWIHDRIESKLAKYGGATTR